MSELNYANPQKAIRDHVDDEDKTLNETFTVNERKNRIRVGFFRESSSFGVKRCVSSVIDFGNVRTPDEIIQRNVEGVGDREKLPVGGLTSALLIPLIGTFRHIDGIGDCPLSKMKLLPETP